MSVLHRIPPEGGGIHGRLWALLSCVVGQVDVEVDADGPYRLKCQRRTRQMETRGAWAGHTNLADGTRLAGNTESLEIVRTRADRDTQLVIELSAEEGVTVSEVRVIAKGSGARRGRIEELTRDGARVRLDPIGEVSREPL